MEEVDYYKTKLFNKVICLNAFFELFCNASENRLFLLSRFNEPQNK